MTNFGSETWFGKSSEDVPLLSLDEFSDEVFASYTGPEDGLGFVFRDTSSNRVPSNTYIEAAGVKNWNIKDQRAYGICKHSRKHQRLDFFNCLVFVAIYIHVKWKFGFWKRMGVPSPDYFPYIGTMREIKKQGIYEFDKTLITKYGRIVGMYLGSNPSLLIADPEIIKNISVKEFSKAPNRFQHFSETKNEMRHGLTAVEDDHWRFMRNTLLPTFSSGKMRKMDPLLRMKYKLLLKSLKTNADEGKPIEFKQTFGAYTMDVIASLGFGMDILLQFKFCNVFY